MGIKPQLHLNVKQCKFFTACNLDNKWKCKNSNNQEYTALENGASVILSLMPSTLTNILYFKKGVNIWIKNSHIDYYDHDLS
jgi:hypothetical protein